MKRSLRCSCSFPHGSCCTVNRRMPNSAAKRRAQFAAPGQIHSLAHATAAFAAAPWPRKTPDGTGMAVRSRLDSRYATTAEKALQLNSENAAGRMGSDPKVRRTRQVESEQQQASATSTNSSPWNRIDYPSCVAKLELECS